MTSEEIVKKVLEASSIPGLNPVQDMAVKAGLFERRNMVLAAPTASGKTLVSEMASLKTILLNHRKVVYIVPLRALASEKYEEFKKKYEPLGIRVGMSIGDYDQSDPWLANYDLIIVTSEKMDSLLRHGISWTDSIGLVVADEIHLLDSPNRGPTLEIVLTRLMHSTKPEILGLSATI
ncbi:MAG: DEAD/DEAH box helicase, partial [Candidatus Aenigmarchaeota archaeon]|nr:DEAD/DEAH box helicase [Candidatus Aenigmarchaeota archaeon]